MKNYLILIIFMFIFVACSSQIPQFDSEKSFDILEEQCEIGPRYPGSDGIELCRSYIHNELIKNKAQVESQIFEAEMAGNIYQCENIIAHYYPRKSRRILLGAHYDTRPWADKEDDKSLHNQPILGANDAASGVAVLLEISRILSENIPDQFGVDLVFFDAEDMGEYGDEQTWCVGSRYFAENYQEEIPEKAIVIDMIGDADLRIQMEYFSYQFSPSLTTEVWDIARDLGFNEFENTIGTAVYDDHYPLMENGFDVIDIIDFDYPHWHKLSDTPENCSENSLYVVGQTMLHLIYGE